MNGIYKAYAVMLSAALLMSGTMVGMDHDGDESIRVSAHGKRRENKIHRAAEDDNNNNNRHAPTLRDEDALVGDDEDEVADVPTENPVIMIRTTPRSYRDALMAAPKGRAVARAPRAAPRNEAAVHAAAMNLATQQQYAEHTVATAVGIDRDNYQERKNSQDPYDMKFVQACREFKADQQEKKARAVQLAFEIAIAADNLKICSNQQDKEYWQRSVKDYEITAHQNGCGHVVVGSK